MKWASVVGLSMVLYPALGAVLSESEEMGEPASAPEAGGFLGAPNVDTNSELAILLMKAVRNVPRKEQVRDAERVLALDPSDTVAQQTLARLYLAENRLDQAGELFWKVARAAPGDPAKLEELGFVLLATGDHANGFRVYQALVQAGHRTPVILFNYAAACQYTGRGEEALKHLQSFLAEQPRHFRGLYNLGVMQGRAGRNEDAVRALESARKQQPKPYMVLAALARLQRETGQMDEFQRTRGQLVALVGESSAAALLEALELPLYLIR